MLKNILERNFSEASCRPSSEEIIMSDNPSCDKKNRYLVNLGNLMDEFFNLDKYIKEKISYQTDEELYGHTYILNDFKINKDATRLDLDVTIYYNTSDANVNAEYFDANITLKI